jgi:hypothetical protein
LATTFAYQHTQFDLNRDAWFNLASFLKAYIGSISLALVGVGTILLAIRLGN